MLLVKRVGVTAADEASGDEGMRRGLRSTGGGGGVHLHHFYVDFLGYVVEFTSSIHPFTDLLALNYISIQLRCSVAGALKFARYLKLFHLRAFLTLAQTNKKPYLLHWEDEAACLDQLSLLLPCPGILGACCAWHG